MHFRYDHVITKLAAESAGKRNENWSALGSYVQEYIARFGCIMWYDAQCNIQVEFLINSFTLK